MPTSIGLRIKITCVTEKVMCDIIYAIDYALLYSTNNIF